MMWFDSTQPRIVEQIAALRIDATTRAVTTISGSPFAQARR